MTTVCVRDGVMAADSRISTSGQWVGDVDKIRRIGDCVVGCAGEVGPMSEYLDWFASKCSDGVVKRAPPELKQGDEHYAFSVIVMKKKEIWMADGLGYPYKVRGEFCAIGSGGAYALGAMAMGATAEQAVRAAMRFDGHSGGRVKAIKL